MLLKDRNLILSFHPPWKLMTPKYTTDFFICNNSYISPWFKISVLNVSGYINSTKNLVHKKLVMIVSFFGNKFKSL